MNLVNVYEEYKKHSVQDKKTAIANLIGSAPDSLDTLNELAVTISSAHRNTCLTCRNLDCDAHGEMMFDPNCEEYVARQSL